MRIVSLLLLVVACRGAQSVEETPASNPAPPPPAARPLIPPGTVGDSRTAIEGCLRAEKSEAAGAAHPVSRSHTVPVRVSITGTGAIVTHELAHACCLEGEVDTKVEATRVIVRETLSGRACRCMCTSKLQTAVRLEPGDYTVAVLLSQSGEERQIHEETVTIPPLRR